MAAVQGSIPTFCRFGPSSSPKSFISQSNFRQKSNRRNSKGARICIAMVQQQAVQGATAAYAKEMERLSAKESLLLAFKDAGGFEALMTGKVIDMQRIDVMERITALERLNPTPRPTTSPYLEGRWNFEWFGFGSPAFSTLLAVMERIPATLACLSRKDYLWKDSYGKVTFNFKVLNSVESKLTLSSKLSVEGPLRMKEEFEEGFLESPAVIQEAVPDQLRGALGQAAGAIQQLPVPLRDAVSSGIRVPLSGTLQRVFMISYLDDEIFITRDAFGVPEVMTRLEVTPVAAEPVTEYQS